MAWRIQICKTTIKDIFKVQMDFAHLFLKQEKQHTTLWHVKDFKRMYVPTEQGAKAHRIACLHTWYTWKRGVC